MNLLEIDWAWGAMMTGVGMGVVFGLLAVLWLLLWAIGRWDAAGAARAARLMASDADAPASASMTSAPQVTVTGADGLDDDTIAAIAVAVVKHADIRRKQAAPEMRTSAPGSQLWASRWVAVGRALQNAPYRRS